MRNAVVHERIDFIRFVKDGVYPELRAIARRQLANERGDHTLQPTALVNLRSGERKPLEHFSPRQRVHAVAGIGNPQRFFNTLEALNWRPVPHPFADHAQYDLAQLSFEPSLPLLMTEKDAVKCRAFAAADWWYLAVDAVPTPAFVDWLDKELARLIPGS